MRFELMNHMQIIRERLTYLCSLIQTNSKGGYNDINKYAESLLLPILNSIYSAEFKRLEYEQKNFPAIDIGCLDKKIAFQITSNKDYTNKIKDTFSKFFEYKLNNKYDNLYILFLSIEAIKTKKNFTEEIKLQAKKKDVTLYIWNITDLIEVIEEQKLPKITEISKYLANQFIPQLRTLNDYLFEYKSENLIINTDKRLIDKCNRFEQLRYFTPYLKEEQSEGRIFHFLIKGEPIHSPDSLYRNIKYTTELNFGETSFDVEYKVDSSILRIEYLESKFKEKLEEKSVHLTENNRKKVINKKFFFLLITFSPESIVVFEFKKRINEIIDNYFDFNKSTVFIFWVFEGTKTIRFDDIKLIEPELDKVSPYDINEWLINIGVSHSYIRTEILKDVFEIRSEDLGKENFEKKRYEMSALIQKFKQLLEYNYGNN